MVELLWLVAKHGVQWTGWSAGEVNRRAARHMANIASDLDSLQKENGIKQFGLLILEVHNKAKTMVEQQWPTSVNYLQLLCSNRY